MALKSKLAALSSTLVTWLMVTVANAETQMNMREGVTDVSANVYAMHQTALWIVTGIGVVVFGAMAYSIFMHTKAKNPKPATFSHSTAVEIVWTIIPFILLIILAVPATKALVEQYDTSDSEMTVKITGWQWKWEYEYMDSGIKFFSNLSTPRDVIEGTSETSPQDQTNYLLEVDNELVLPVDTKVRFLLTAADVIHSWWVPEFAVKKDAIPGFINESWTKINKPGIYRGQCTELCGKDHGFMPVVVRALPKEEYQDWVSKKLAEREAAEKAAKLAALQNWDKSKLMKLGEEVYAGKCAMCHGAQGEGGVGKAITGSAIATGPKAGHIDIIFNGKAGSAMQSFKDQLTSAEIAAVVTYQRNALGNSKGDLVQPSEIEKMR